MREQGHTRDWSRSAAVCSASLPGSWEFDGAFEHLKPLQRLQTTISVRGIVYLIFLHRIRRVAEESKGLQESVLWLQQAEQRVKQALALSPLARAGFRFVAIPPKSVQESPVLCFHQDPELLPPAVTRPPLLARSEGGPLGILPVKDLPPRPLLLSSPAAGMPSLLVPLFALKLDRGRSAPPVTSLPPHVHSARR